MNAFFENKARLVYLLLAALTGLLLLGLPQRSHVSGQDDSQLLTGQVVDPQGRQIEDAENNLLTETGESIASA